MSAVIPGSNSLWTLVSKQDFPVVSSYIEFTDLPSNEILKILFSGIVDAASLNLDLSNDNGSTWLTSSSNYKGVGTTSSGHDNSASVQNATPQLVSASGGGQEHYHGEITIFNARNSAVATGIRSSCFVESGLSGTIVGAGRDRFYINQSAEDNDALRVGNFNDASASGFVALLKLAL